MKPRRLFWFGVATSFGMFATAVVLLWPVRGRFTEADCERVKPGMTLNEVEAMFGPAISDEQSILIPRAEGNTGFWKGWGDRVSQIHVEFDPDERVRGWVLHPLRPHVIHHILHR